MEYRVKILEPTVALVSFKTNQEDFEQAKEKTYEELSKKLKIPGFRKGKIPVEIVKKYTGDSIIQETIETLIRETYNRVLEELQPKPISIPAFEIINFDEKNFDLEFTAEYEFLPEIQLSSYKKLKVKKEQLVEEENLIDEVLQQLAKLYKNYIPKETGDPEKDRVEPEDYVLLEIKIINKVNPKQKLEIPEFAYWLEKGDTEFPELKEHLLGKRVNEEIEYEKKFQDTKKYKEFSNKNVLIKAKILEIRYGMVPPVDDELAKMAGYSTLEELRNFLKKEILRQSEKYIEGQVLKRIFDEIINKNTIPVPDVLVRKRMEILIQNFLDNLHLPEKERERLYNMIQESPVQLEEFRKSAISQIRREFIIDKIFKIEGFQNTEEEIKNELKDYVERVYNVRVKEEDRETLYNYYKNQENLMEYLDTGLREKKVVKFLLDNTEYEKGERITTKEIYEKGIIKL